MKRAHFGTCADPSAGNNEYYHSIEVRYSNQKNQRGNETTRKGRQGKSGIPGFGWLVAHYPEATTAELIQPQIDYLDRLIPFLEGLGK